MSYCRRPLLPVLLPILFLAPASAQRGTGELRLSVKDPTGIGIAATVELRNDSTKTPQTLDVPADGRYSFKNLPFGLYRVAVTHAGFAPSSELIEIRSEVPQSREIVLGIHPIEPTIQ